MEAGEPGSGAGGDPVAGTPARRHRRLWPEVALHVLVGVVLAVVGYQAVVGNGLTLPLSLLLIGMVALLAVRAMMILRENRRLVVDYEATDAFKTQLLRFISHEIANPLSPLK